MSNVIDFAEAGARIRRRRLPVRQQLMFIQLEQGNTVAIEIEGYANFPTYLKDEMRYWLGMPKPPAPSVLQLAGPIAENEFPPPAC